MYILESEILSIPQKLKAIRKYLGLKQEDLTNGHISRSLISYIENGKVELTKETASIISNSIKKVLDDKNIPLEVDVEYLTSDERKQAKLLIERHLIKLRELKNVKDDVSFTELISKIEKILTKWELPDKRLVAYELIGDMYYERSEFDESYIYYIKALENSIKENQIYKYAYILIKLGRTCIRSNKYLAAIKYNDEALSVLNAYKIEDDDLFKKCLFNNALAYKSLKEYDKFIKNIHELEMLYKDFTPKQSIDILTVKGSYYRRRGDFNKAEDAYNKGLKLAKIHNKLEDIAMLYVNMSILFEEKNELQKSINYVKESLKIREHIGDERISITLLELGKKFKLQKEYDSAEKYLLRGINETTRKDNLRAYVDIYIELLDIYISTDEHYLALKLIEQIEKIYKEQYKINNGKEIEDMETFLLIAAKYLLETNISQSKELLNLILERRSEE